jgi:hypothetical protein
VLFGCGVDWFITLLAEWVGSYLAE